MNDRTPNHRCPDCKGTGIISRPYMIGMKGGDLYTMTVCSCTKDMTEKPAAMKEGEA